MQEFCGANSPLFYAEDANLPERCGPGRPRKGWVRTVVTRANGSVYMGQVPVGGYNEESSSSHAPDRQAACKEQQEHDEDPEPSTPQRIRKQTPEALAEPLHTNASRPPSPIPAPSPTKTAPSYCCCPRESDCPSRLPDVMANVLTTQSVLAGNFPKPVDSKKDWVTYCLPHGKGLALTTLRMVTFKNDVRKLVTWCTCNPAELDDVHPLLTKPSLTGYNVSDCGHLPHECEHVQVLMVRLVLLHRFYVTPSTHAVVHVARRSGRACTSQPWRARTWQEKDRHSTYCNSQLWSGCPTALASCWSFQATVSRRCGGSSCHLWLKGRSLHMSFARMGQ